MSHKPVQSSTLGGELAVYNLLISMATNMATSGFGLSCDKWRSSLLEARIGDMLKCCRAPVCPVNQGQAGLHKYQRVTFQGDQGSDDWKLLETSTGNYVISETWSTWELTYRQG